MRSTFCPGGLDFQYQLGETGLMGQTTRVSAATLAKRLGPAPDGREQPAYRTLADRIRAAVLDGRLAVGTGLPSERELSTGLGVSRTTVNAAYSQLREQGWLVSRRGSGSSVRLPADPGAPAGASASGRPGMSYAAGGIFGWRDGVGWHDPAEQATGMIDLTTACLPAPTALTGAVAQAAALLPRYLASDGYLPFGLPELRDVIAARYTAAGVPTTTEQILVTSGAQHAFTIVLDTLSGPGDRVVIECPTYPVALDAVRNRRRTPVPIGLGEPGETAWDVELMSATLRQSAARLAYLIPDFQNPTGSLMDTTTREAVIAAARPAKTLVLADESFRDVPFPTAEGQSSELPPPMAAFDREDGTRVLCLGSVSKAFWGGLRVGWVRAAPGLIQRLAATRALGDMAGPVLDQLVVAGLLADPAAALAEQRSRLAAGASALRAALAAHLPSWLPSNPSGGTSLWVRLPGPFATDLALVAPSAGVRIAPGPRFGPDGTMESFLRLPFTASLEQLVTAVRRLASVADRAAAGSRTGLPGWVA
jgi:DNA-binding transcriptional MocR family regulator